jgi:hypothetical protein
MDGKIVPSGDSKGLQSAVCRLQSDVLLVPTCCGVGARRPVMRSISFREMHLSFECVHGQLGFARQTDLPFIK